jgi:hypothetical protein
MIARLPVLRTKIFLYFTVGAGYILGYAGASRPAYRLPVKAPSPRLGQCVSAGRARRAA